MENGCSSQSWPLSICHLAICLETLEWNELQSDPICCSYCHLCSLLWNQISGQIPRGLDSNYPEKSRDFVSGFGTEPR